MDLPTFKIAFELKPGTFYQLKAETGNLKKEVYGNKTVQK
jgi:hypothetical protein